MQPAAPAVRRRPKDRKKQILDRAAQLFIERGFHSVKLEEIAESAGVTARALYRHYDNKNALLTAVILNAQDEYQSARNASAAESDATVRPLRDELPNLIAAAVETRALTVLWQREARYLNDGDRSEVRSRINAIVAGMQAGVRLEMPDMGAQHSELRAWAVSSTLTSLGRHNLSLPGAELEELLYRACMAAAQTPPVGTLEALGTPADDEGALYSRYETLLAAGARLFRARGYQAVSTSEIGKGVGIAGPGLYRSFSSKQAILDTLVHRFDEWSTLECVRAMRSKQPAAQQLEGLVWGRVRLSVDEPDLVSVAITELPSASAEVGEVFVKNQADRDGVWIELVRQLVPETTVAQGRLLVAAAVSFIEDVARTWHLTRRSGVAEEMTAIALAILTSTSPGQD